ncbi:MAG: hypothetical protein WCC64_15920 [Aliidongia sp.]
MLGHMKARKIQQPADHNANDQDETPCPPEVIEVFRQCLASLDRGEGLTTAQMRQQLHHLTAKRDQSR